MAWALALNDPPAPGHRDKAVEYAQLAVRLQGAANHFNNLGVAHYQNGQFAEAVEALHKAGEMIEGGDRMHRMFLAMAHWKMGNHEEARRCFEQGVAWQEEQNELPEDQKRFREMAEELMGIEATISPQSSNLETIPENL